MNVLPLIGPPVPSRPRPVRWRGTAGVLALTLLSCTGDSPIEVDHASVAIADSRAVRDLAVTRTGNTSLTVSWTQVADGLGDPAWYRLKYARPSIDWKTATVGCDRTLVGDLVGAPMSCTILNLQEDTEYEVQLMSYRLIEGMWQGAVYSNVAAGTTASPAAPASVQDLTVAGATGSTLTLRWTQVDDGTGQPADYRVKYGTSPLRDWKTATDGCDVAGNRIGAEASCTIEGLSSSTRYDVQLMSYRVVGGVWQDAQYSNVATGETEATTTFASTTSVQDLTVGGATASTLTMRWTQVDDGTGAPARYRIRYDPSPLQNWKKATIGCDRNIVGTQIGAPISCTIEGMSPGTSYDVQLMSYRVVGGVWQDARYSNVATGRTAASAGGSGASGIWIGPAEIAVLPTSGAAWNNVKAAADRSCGSVDLADQEQSTNVCIMAKALVYARIGGSSYRLAVVDAIRQIVTAGTYGGRALSLGRELGAYVIAADLIGLEGVDPTLDLAFRARLRELRTIYTWGAASSLVDCHEKRPNNWGAHCGASRAAIAVYLGDTEDLARTAQVFKGYLGDRSSYAGFSYGGPDDDLSWQCDRSRPVGINPVGCTRDGLSLDGVLPDDQRRGGSFTTSPPRENYVWEALQGLLAQAVILHRAGYPVWEWEDRALLRAVRWLHEVVDYPAEGDDQWQAHLVNRYYGTTFPATTPARPGKNVGWTDWTHR